jgi:biopolymer transport protein ExbB/TolQ
MSLKGIAKRIVLALAFTGIGLFAGACGLIPTILSTVLSLAT